MNSVLIRNIFRFILLVILQVFVFDKIRISGFLNPYIYVMFILMLPFEISGWLLLLSSFLLGLSIDIFSHTGGMHAAASVFMAYARPGVIRLLGKKEDLEPGQFPNARDFGTLWFTTYSFILVFLHHLILFNIEIFRFDEFFVTLLKVLINAVLTTVLILMTQFLFYRQKTG
jgi:hypothetical protein